MRYAIKLDELRVGAPVEFKRVDLGAATKGKARVAALRPDLNPEWIAVRVPGYSMQMGAYAFTVEYVPAEIKILHVISREGNTFEVETLMDVPLRLKGDA